MEVQVNYVAVLVAAVVGMAIGYAWYSPMLFAKPWMKEMGHTKETMSKDQKGMGKLYALSFVALLVTAYMLNHVMALSENFYGYTPLMTGFTSAFFMWFGFIAPVQLTDVLFGSKRGKLFAINTGYQLATLLAMGVVLALFA